MPDKPKIEDAVGEKIDDKIIAAQIIPSIDRQSSIPPTTTSEQDLLSLAQRGWNETWEKTQSRIAQGVVYTTCLGVVVRIITRAVGYEVETLFPPEWWTVLGLVIGFYFGRTNHARMGDQSKDWK